MDKYEQRGVSAGKEEVHAAVKDLYHGLYPKAFCKVYPDYLGADDAFCNVMSSDGSGTKSILAYLSISIKLLYILRQLPQFLNSNINF